jgi:hypothetical protein
MTVIIGLDLGQAADYTAQCVIDYVAEITGGYAHPVTEKYFDVVKLSRFPLGTAYTDIIDSVKGFVDSDQFWLIGNKRRAYQLVMDATGVGRPLVDMARRAKLNVIPVTITAGVNEKFDVETGYWNVGKGLLVSNIRVHTEPGGKLRVAKDLKDWDILQNEMKTFTNKTTPKGNDVMEAWREQDHDDLFLALALAAWWGEYHSTAGDPQPTQRKPHPLEAMFPR